MTVIDARRPGAFAAQLAVLALAGCTTPELPSPVETPNVPPIARIDPSDPALRSTIVGGEAAVPVVKRPVTKARRGTIQFNFPSADVAVVAKSVLGDTLDLDYGIAPGTTGRVTLVTGKVARSEVLGLFETALRAANLAMVQQGGRFLIQPVASAAASGQVTEDALGYGTQVLTLQFINADEAKKLLDSVLPGVVTATDPASNHLTIAGTTGQRASANDLIKQFDVNWLRNMSFALFVPQRTDSRLIVPELDKLINAPDAPTRGVVRLLSMERMNGILAITAQRQYLDDVKRWIDILDREGESNEARLFVYRVQNGRAKDLARTLNEAFTGTGGSTSDEATAPFESNSSSGALSNSPTGSSSTRAPNTGYSGGNTGNSSPPPLASTVSSTNTGLPVQSGGSTNNLAAPQTSVGRITSDEINNAVIVYGTPRQYAVVEDALRKLDVLPYQVLIEAAITEVSLTNELKYGVKWNFLSGQSNFVQNNGVVSTLAAPATGFNYFFSNNNDIAATLTALESRTKVKVISAPKILVLNNQTASLQVGDQVPIQTQQQQSVNGGAGNGNNIINSIEYRDTGVILKVTPRVNSGGLVLLDVAQEVSSVKNTTTGVSTSPTISTRRIATSIAIQDGQVIALGGLFRDSQISGNSGVPFASRIPVLGALFGNKNQNQDRTELIVLLKPHVVRTIDDGRAITEELRAKLRTLEPFKTQGKIP